MNQRQPPPGAVRVELRHVKHALVERTAPRGARIDESLFPHRTPPYGAHKFVEVIAVLIIAGIDHRLAMRLGEGCAFMLDAPEGAAFHGGRIRGKWVDFDNPTEAIDFLPVPAEIETG